jgi:hypothetical protein
MNYLVVLLDGTKAIAKRGRKPVGDDIQESVLIDDVLALEPAEALDVLDVDDGFGGTIRQAVLNDAKKTTFLANKQAAFDQIQADSDAKEAKIANIKALNPNTDLNSIPQLRDALIEVMEVLGLR